MSFNRNLYEGVGDVAQLDNVYSTVYTTLYQLFLVNIPNMYDLVTGAQRSVSFQMADPFNRPDELKLTIKVMLGEEWMSPGYSPNNNTLIILIRDWLLRAGWVYKTGDKLPVNFGKERFIHDMEKSLSYGLRSTFDTPSVCRTFNHELVHYFDYNTKPGMMVNHGKQEKFDLDREKRTQANGSEIEIIRDQLFPANYAAATREGDNTRWHYTGPDADELRKVREGFNAHDFDVYCNHKGSQEYIDLIKRSNLYKQHVYLNSIPEMRARIAEQLPWLFSLRKSNSDKLNVPEIVEKLLDGVFVIPDKDSFVPPPHKNIDAYRAYHRRKILPGARKSVMKRLAKIVMAANRVDVEKYTTLPMRIKHAVYILSSDTQTRNGNR